MSQLTSHSIALTGASSFTGLWIGRELAARGWNVHALIPRSLSEYSGIKAKRLKLLSEVATIYPGVRAEDGSMKDWVSAHQPEIWVHHHHWMENFRAPDYDIARAEKVALEPLPEIVEALRHAGTKGVIFSGSYFEPGEGGQSEDASVTPYSKSKQTTWIALKQEMAKQGFGPLSKIVIPNPFGPLEAEDRLIPILIKTAQAGGSFNLRTPDAMGDNLPVVALARVYADVAERLRLGGGGEVVRPSGWIYSTEKFVSEVVRELIVKRLGLNPPKIIRENGQFKGYTNPHGQPIQCEPCEVWDHYAEWVK